MATGLHPSPTEVTTRQLPIDPATALSALRAAVGVCSWVSPSLTWRTVALGSMNGDPRAAVVTRLFGVREVVLGQAVRHRHPEVRRAALQIGIAVDSIDIVASLIALRKGAPKAIVLTFTAAAALGVALGAAALRTSGGDVMQREHQRIGTGERGRVDLDAG
jgi:hypothetical protein